MSIETLKVPSFPSGDLGVVGKGYESNF